VSRAKLLDTFPLVRFFKDEPGVEKVEKILILSRQSRQSLLMSEINAGELYYAIARKEGERRAEEILASLTLFRIALIPATWPLVLEAARLKAKYPLSYADCFAVATARKQEATLVTGDPEFKQVEDLVSIEWI